MHAQSINIGGLLHTDRLASCPIVDVDDGPGNVASAHKLLFELSSYHLHDVDCMN